MKIAVIGAGLGGLASACLLASKGHEITVFEKNENPGGKINEIRAEGFRFDTGPSLLTMPALLEDLFKRCGSSLNNYLTLQSLEPLCRYFYSDGTVFNCHKDREKTIAEIQRIAPEDTNAYRQFLDYSEGLYHRTKDAFLFNPLYEFDDVQSLRLRDAFKIDAFTTVARRVDSMFSTTYIQQFFKRFTTYNGSSPFRAPATLNVIPHVELAMGGYYIDGGMYRLVDALMELAKKKDVQFHFNAPVEFIETFGGAVKRVQTVDKTFETEIVVSNSDAHETYLNLLGRDDVSFLKKKRLKKVEPSCSGFVLLLGIDKKYKQLSHHNIFFSADYRKEFDAIFNRKVMPDDPTIYVANTSCKNPDHAVSGGSNLFVLVNAPYLSDSWDWTEHQEKYSNFIIDELDRRGLNGLRKSIVYHHHISPVDFYTDYQSYKGSIYGTSSNSKMAAFMRQKNKARNVDGLYLAGGSTHPGGGIPLVIQSALNVVELIERYE